MSSKLAIIPARGGSKRIPGKNIKDFLGKPIIAYSIEAALESNLFDEVMVSTDDPEIAEIATAYGAHVPFLRSKENADDHSILADVITEVLHAYQENNIIFDFTCCILPTAPFITSDRISQAFDLLYKGNFNAIVPVVPFTFPIQRALKVDNKLLSFVWPENEFERSQDFMPTYHDAGQFYWIKNAAFRSEKKLFMSNTAPLLLPPLEVQDIDTEDDWKTAELKLKILRS